MSDERQEHSQPASTHHSSLSFSSLLYCFIDCAAQLVRLDLAKVPEYKLAVFVIQKSCRHIAAPIRINKMNRSLRVFFIQEHDRHRGFHAFKKRLDLGLYVFYLVQCYCHKV